MDFKNEISEINDAICEFNKFIHSDYEIPTLDLKTGFETTSIVKVVHRDWGAFGFPNNGTRGVYFVFGREIKKGDKKGVYIGKSSFSSSTSARLYQHLNPYREEEFFQMQSGPESYVIDYIASLNLDQKEVPFLASALEEFLILRLKDKLRLLNGTGNS